MTDLRTVESVILTNTIVTALCIVLFIILIIFALVFLIPSIRRRWFQTNEINNSIIDISTLNRRTSLGSSRFNPIFEPITGTTTSTTTQFGTLFHPQATTATLLHPTIWTSMTPLNNNNNNPQSTPLSSNPSTQQTTTNAEQRPPKKILKKETA